MRIFAKREQTDILGFAESFTDDQLKTAIGDALAVFAVVYGAYKNHESLVKGAWSSLKRLGPAFIIQAITADDSEREALAEKLVAKSVQMTRIKRLVDEVLTSLKSEQKEMTDGR